MEIIEKSVVNGLPDDHEVEYAGQIDENTFFVIYRPENDHSYSLSNWKVSIGPVDNLQEVEVIGGMKYGDGGIIVLNTVIGTFFFPPSKRKDRWPLFNSHVIEVF